MWGLFPLSTTTARRGSVRFASVAAACALVLGLGACGDDATDDPQDPDATVDADADMPSVSAGFDSDPTLTFPDGEAPEGLQVEVLDEGDGPDVDLVAAVVANYEGSVWGSEEPFDSSFERDTPSMFSLRQVVQGWSDGIPGHPVGSRLLISIPPDLGYGPEGNEGAGIGGEDTIVFVVDIHDAVDPAEAGDPDATPAPDTDDVPVTIDGGLGEPASVTVDDGAAEPSEPEMTVIAEGSGDPLAVGDTVAVALSMASWDNAQQESSWPGLGTGAMGPQVGRVGAGQWFDLMIDQPVGSRVLVTLPPDESGQGLAILADIVQVQGAAAAG